MPSTLHTTAGSVFAFYRKWSTMMHTHMDADQTERNGEGRRRGETIRKSKGEEERRRGKRAENAIITSL